MRGEQSRASGRDAQRAQPAQRARSAQGARPAQPPSWAVVVPVLDEATALPGLLAELDAEPGLLERVIFVDNGSRDGSRESLVARGLTVLDEPRRGYGYACLTGAGAALSRSAGAVVFMEADGSDDPRDLPLLVDPVLRGEVDLMIGVRGRGACAPPAHAPPARGYRDIRHGMPIHQRIGNRLASVCLRLLFELDVPDNGPFRAVSADLLRRLEMEQRPFAWTTEMLVKAHQAGARIAFVETHYRPRAGRSKIAGTARGSVGAFEGIFVTMLRLRWRGSDGARRADGPSDA